MSEQLSWQEKVRRMMNDIGKDYYACCRELGRHGGRVAALRAKARRKGTADPVATMERRKLW
jgi:hypothetical protein